MGGPPYGEYYVKHPTLIEYETTHNTYNIVFVLYAGFL